jgi:hypothetical protein
MRLLIITLFLFILCAVTNSHAITIAVGGNIEDTSLRTDQMTADTCSFVYNCSDVHFVSIQGKNGLVNAGSFDNTNLEAKYAKTALSSSYADFTEKSVWAYTGLTEETKTSKVFTSQWVNDNFVDNAYHSVKALGGEKAPEAEQSLLVENYASKVINVRKTDFYSRAGSAGAAEITNDAPVYVGGNIFENAEKSAKWVRDNRYTSY